jgi:hypothetical protein
MDAKGDPPSTVATGQERSSVHAFIEPEFHKFLINDVGDSTDEVDDLILAGGVMHRALEDETMEGNSCFDVFKAGGN